MFGNQFRKGVFSFDTLVATLIVSTTLAVMLYAFVASAESFSRQSGVLHREQRALVFADKLLKKCAGGGGLAECENRLVYSHSLDDSFLKKVAGGGAMEFRRAFIIVSSIWGETLYEFGGAANASNCVTRVALLRGKQVLLRACIE